MRTLQIGTLIDNGVENSPPLVLVAGGRSVEPPRKVVGLMADDNMQDGEHNLASFLLKIASLLEPNGCRTVQELLATDEFTRRSDSEFAMEPLSPTGKALLKDLGSLDYVALRNLAAAVKDPRVLLDDHSLL